MYKGILWNLYCLVNTYSYLGCGNDSDNEKRPKVNKTP